MNRVIVRLHSQSHPMFLSNAFPHISSKELQNLLSVELEISAVCEVCLLQIPEDLRHFPTSLFVWSTSQTHH